MACVLRSDSDHDHDDQDSPIDLGRPDYLNSVSFAEHPVDMQSAAPLPARPVVAQAWRWPTSAGALSLLRLICFGRFQVSSSLSNSPCRYLISSKSLGRAACCFMAIKSVIAQTGIMILPKSISTARCAISLNGKGSRTNTPRINNGLSGWENENTILVLSLIQRSQVALSVNCMGLTGSLGFRPYASMALMAFSASCCSRLITRSMSAVNLA